MNIATQLRSALQKWNMLGRISLTGGEPFLSPTLYKIIDFIEDSQEFKQFDILTNGTCIGLDDIEKLKKCKKLHQVQISVDGSCSETHDKVRGSGTFNKVVQTIEKLKAQGLSVSLMFTLMKHNMHEALSMIDFAQRVGVSAITIERVTPCGHSNVKDVLTKDEIKDIYEGVTLKANKVGKELTIRRLRPLWINTMHLDSCENSKIGGFCPVGFTSMAILWDGTVLPCRRLEIPIGNILKDGIFKIWYESDVLWKIRDKNNLKGKCHNCPQVERCGGCRAIAYELTKDYMGEDPQCWI
jgi:radical SAM protein with 4Fe4S-binding SPASM domain